MEKWFNKGSLDKPCLIKKKKNGLLPHLAVGEFASNITKGLYSFFVIVIRIAIFMSFLHKLVKKKTRFCITIWFESDYLADLLKCFPSDHCFGLYCRMPSKGPAQAGGAVI